MSKTPTPLTNDLADAYDGPKDIHDKAYIALCEMTKHARTLEIALGLACDPGNICPGHSCPSGKTCAECRRDWCLADAKKEVERGQHKKIGCATCGEDINAGHCPPDCRSPSFNHYIDLLRNSVEPSASGYSVVTARKSTGTCPQCGRLEHLTADTGICFDCQKVEV